MKENLRKCLKCGTSITNDPNITLHRFPKPGTKNIWRCESWARFVYPHLNWSSQSFQEKLYKEHRMLCSRHFKATSFFGKNLGRSAVPIEESDEPIPSLGISSTPVSKPHQPLGTSNILNLGPVHEPTPGPSKVQCGSFHELTPGPSQLQCGSFHEPTPGPSQLQSGSFHEPTPGPSQLQCGSFHEPTPGPSQLQCGSFHEPTPGPSQLQSGSFHEPTPGPSQLQCGSFHEPTPGPSQLQSGSFHEPTPGPSQLQCGSFHEPTPGPSQLQCGSFHEPTPGPSQLQSGSFHEPTPGPSQLQSGSFHEPTPGPSQLQSGSFHEPTPGPSQLQSGSFHEPTPGPSQLQCGSFHEPTPGPSQLQSGSFHEPTPGLSQLQSGSFHEPTPGPSQLQSGSFHEPTPGPSQLQSGSFHEPTPGPSQLQSGSFHEPTPGPSQLQCGSFHEPTPGPSQLQSGSFHEPTPGPSQLQCGSFHEPTPGPSQLQSGSFHEPTPGPSQLQSGSFHEPTPGPSQLQCGSFHEPTPGLSQLQSRKCLSKDKMSTSPPSQQLQSDEANKSKERLELLKKKERYLYMKCRKHMQKVAKLEKSMKKLKNEAYLNALLKDESVKKLIESKLSSPFALLLQGQIKNFRRKSKGRRWTSESKIIALRLYKRSPTCYRLLRRLICLPAPNTLKTLLRCLKLDVGINTQIFNVIKKTIVDHPEPNKEYILMFDEMSIKKNLNYNNKTDKIEGFQDHGVQGRSKQVASHALVFMVAGIRKKVKQPVAYYLSGGSVTGDRLAVLIKEVLKNCFEAGINIAATVCDMDGVNRRALGILGASAEHPTINVLGHNIVTLFDTPHLLKCFRNNFLKHDIKFTTDISSNEKHGIGIAKWSHLEKFFELDNSNPNFVFAPSLRKDHLNPNTKQKMKVKLAAQVFSHTVAAGMFAKIAQGELPAESAATANVLSDMDKLFDSVNASSPDLRRGKTYSTNIKKESIHFNHFQKMKKFFQNLKFIGCNRPPPSLEGWVWTLNGIEQIWKQLTCRHPTIKSLATRRLQQDPLENLFGCIRGHCGLNSNPTSGQFVAGLKTAVLSNLPQVSLGNCEKDDNDVLLENYKILLTPGTDEARTEELSTEFNIEAPNILESKDLDEASVLSGELQACAYVCGFIVRRQTNTNKCMECRKALTQETNEQHTFIEFKEYFENKTCLIYSSKDLIMCVEQCATLVNNFLSMNAHELRLKEKLTELLKNSVTFEFLNTCETHKQSNIDHIVKSVFYICVRRFCIVENRKFSDAASESALKRKINILKHK